MINKIREYFSTLEITKGFFIALLASGFIYLNDWGFSSFFIHTLLGLASLYFLLQGSSKTWFWYGIFIGIFLFWWIALSLSHYGYDWGMPIGIFIIALIYGILFLTLAWLIDKIGKKNHLALLLLKALGLLVLSYIHPFGFDWFKPELIFIESYLGIEKWQFALILIALVLTQWQKKVYYLLLLSFAYQPHTLSKPLALDKIAIISTHTSVKEKWDTHLQPKQFQALFQTIDQAIDANKSLIILPESVFPIFINRSPELIEILQQKAHSISIVTGGLYLDKNIPRNSTYIFTKGTMTVANKVILVPFGERNPLPDFLSTWVNDIFYDGAVDYEASSEVVDYTIHGIRYRNAICFEATAEALYVGKPSHMIVLSNNGWFTPSIEPTLQKLLLQYYSQKYGTTIYHAINMSPSYIIQARKVIQVP